MRTYDIIVRINVPDIKSFDNAMLVRDAIINILDGPITDKLMVDDNLSNVPHVFVPNEVE